MLSLPQSGLDVPKHMENQHVLLFDAVDDDILAQGKTTQPWAQILIATAPDMRVAGKEIEMLCDGVNNPVGDLDRCRFL